MKKKESSEKSTVSKNSGKIEKLTFNFKVNYHRIILITTSGKRIAIYSTFGKEDQEIKLDICPEIHQAWNQGSTQIIGDRVDQFNKKYKNFITDQTS